MRLIQKQKNKHLHNVRLTRCEPKEEQKTAKFTEEAYTFEVVGNYDVTLFDANAKVFSERCDGNTQN
ncbi:MAG: hypothetical protein WA631_00100 [Nitrososphaeraceae archaeon]|jgi:hypothetical protein